MDDKEITERLIRNEERSKSNTHRLDRMEPIIDEIHNLTTIMAELVREIQHTNDNVAEIRDKVEILESQPSVRVEQVKTAVITALTTGIVGMLLTSLR